MKEKTLTVLIIEAILLLFFMSGMVYISVILFFDNNLIGMQIFCATILILYKIDNN